MHPQISIANVSSYVQYKGTKKPKDKKESVCYESQIITVLFSNW